MTSDGDHPLGFSRRLLQKIKLPRLRSVSDPGKGERDYWGFSSLELSQIHLGKLRSKIIFSRPAVTRGQVDENRKPLPACHWTAGLGHVLTEENSSDRGENSLELEMQRTFRTRKSPTCQNVTGPIRVLFCRDGGGATARGV